MRDDADDTMIENVKIQHIICHLIGEWKSEGLIEVWIGAVVKTRLVLALLGIRMNASADQWMNRPFHRLGS